MISFTFIREQRQEQGLSDQELANRSGLDSQYLSRLESDRLNADDPLPTIGMLRRLHSVLCEG
jgi:transcriptional regulator with XRE-family HTH domain